MAEFLLENYGKEGLKMHQFNIFKILNYLEDSNGERNTVNGQEERIHTLTIAKKHKYFCSNTMQVLLKRLTFCKIARYILKITGLLEKTGLGQFFKIHRIYR